MAGAAKASPAPLTWLEGQKMGANRGMPAESICGDIPSSMPEIDASNVCHQLNLGMV